MVLLINGVGYFYSSKRREESVLPQQRKIKIRLDRSSSYSGKGGSRVFILDDVEIARWNNRRARDNLISGVISRRPFRRRAQELRSFNYIVKRFHSETYDLIGVLLRISTLAGESQAGNYTGKSEFKFGRRCSTFTRAYIKVF